MVLVLERKLKMFHNMKMSKYNFTVYDKEGNLIIYNFLHRLPSLTKIMRPDVEKFLTLFPADAEIHKTSCEKHIEATKTLLKLGILVDVNTNENVLYESKYYDELFDRKLYLTILPTGNCNFRCAYCFEADQKISRVDMSENAQNAVCKFVQKQIHNYTELHVSWFGGEPLVQSQIIKKLSENIIKICKARFIPYSAEITTNGFLLDASMFDMLYKLNVYTYMVTIDGFKEQHDKLRYTHSGMGTYDTIMKNLLRIKNSKQYKFARVTIRVNVTKSLMNVLDEFIYYIDSLFSDDSRFSFIFLPAEDFSKTKSSESDIFVDVNEVSSHLLKNEVYTKKLYPGILNDYIINPRQGCIASMKNSYVIASDLKVYKCSTHYDMEVNNVGYLSKNGDMLINEAFHSKWYLASRSVQDVSSACKDCFYLPACSDRRKSCPAQFLKSNPKIASCPLRYGNFMSMLSDAILNAANKYSCNLLIL